MKRSSLAVFVCSLLVLLDPLAPPASAQFGFFYGPPQQRRVYRPRRRNAPPKPIRRRAAPPQRSLYPGLAPPPQFPLSPAPLPGAPQPVAPSSPEVPLPPERPAVLDAAPKDAAPKDAAPKSDTAPVVRSPEAPSTSAPKPAPSPSPDVAKPAPPASAGAPATSTKPVFGPPLPPTPPVKPAELPKPPASGVAPSGAKLDDEPRLPEADAACLSRLRALNVDAEPATIGPQVDERCTVVQPVRLKSLTLADGGKVDFPERPTLACVAADTFSTFVRDLLSPLARGTYGASVASVWTGPGLECRSRDHIKGAKLSAHGLGLAIDIAQFKLSDGMMFEVGRPKSDADRTFETAARAAGCGYFHTSLGPGSDSFHATHWHFDLEQRGAKGDSKFCQ